MRILVVPILLLGFLESTITQLYEPIYDDYGIGIESESGPELPPQGRILGSLFKGWKGDGHPLSEFGKIHVVKKGGWGWDGETDHGGQGWGWNTYGSGGGHGNGWGAPATTTLHIKKGWKAKKKSWLKLPKKSFGIHVKGGIGFSFGGKKGEHGGQKVVVQHHGGPGWGWNSGHKPSYGWGGWNSGGWNGWGWNRGGWNGGYDDFNGGDYFEDEDRDTEDDDDDRRRMDLGDYLYEDY